MMKMLVGTKESSFCLPALFAARCRHLSDALGVLAKHTLIIAYGINKHSPKAKLGFLFQEIAINESTESRFMST